MNQADPRKSDMMIGAMILAFCTFAAWRTFFINATPSGTAAGANFVPWVVIGTVSALALMMMGRAYLRLRNATNAEPISMPSNGTLVRMVLFAVLMVFYAAAFMGVGYLPSTLVAFPLGLLLFGERRILVLVGLPIIMTAVVYYAFTEFLNVWLP